MHEQDPDIHCSRFPSAGTGRSGASAGARRPDGPGLLRRRRPDGRRAGQRQARRLDRHHHGRDRRAGPLQLPGRQARARPVRACASAPSATTSTARRRSTSARRPRADLKLRKTEDLASQLSNGEWIASVPGTDEQKSELLNCVGCHTLERVVKSTHTSRRLHRHRAAAHAGLREPEHAAHPAVAPRRAAHGGTRRPAGAGLPRARRFPRNNQPEHRRAGSMRSRRCRARPARRRASSSPNTTCRARRSSHMTWSSMPPASPGIRASASRTSAGSTRRPARSPNIRSRSTSPDTRPDSLGLRTDRDGNLWLGNMYQATIVKFDRKTEKFQYWTLPAEPTSTPRRSTW